MLRPGYTTRPRAGESSRGKRTLRRRRRECWIVANSIVSFGEVALSKAVVRAGAGALLLMGDSGRFSWLGVRAGDMLKQASDQRTNGRGKAEARAKPRPLVPG